MRTPRCLLVAGFLSTTMLTPSPVQAGPVVGFVAGFLTTAVPGLTIAAGAGAAYAAGAGAAAFFTTTLGSLVLSVGFALVSEALKPQAQSTDPGDRLVNYAKPISYFERVYGRVRNGGVMGCTSFRGDRRHYTAILASHSIKRVVDHYLDDVLVETDVDGLVITEPYGDYGSIRTYNGQPGQAADAILVDAIPEWTAAHDMAGLAYAAIYARRTSSEVFSDVYSRGDIWNYAPLIEGNDRIWDPRDETYKYTNNAALVIAHEIVTTLGGEVDWEDVAFEADVSDQLVTNADGGTQRRWTINALFSDDQDWEEIKTILLAACDGFMFERTDGKVGFYVGRWQEPTVTLRDEDFLSLQVTEGLEIGVNGRYVAQYVEPANLYRKTPTGAYIADPDGRQTTREIPALAVDSYDQAIRIAVRTAAVERAQFSLSGRLKLSGKYLMGQRFVRIEHEELGLSMTVEIGKLVRVEDSMSYEFQGVSTVASDHQFDAATQSPPRPVYENLSSDNSVAEVAGLSGSVMGAGGIRYEWNTQEQSLTQEIRLRSIDAGQPDWQSYIAATGQSSFAATGLLDGATYEAQVRNRTSAGRVSGWLPVAPISITAIVDSTPPPELTTFSAARVGADIEIALTSPNDAGYFATRILRADYPTGFVATPDVADAIVVRIEYGLPGNVDGWIDSSVPVGVHVYWAEPINRSGIPGPLSGPETIEIT
ncbi:hypothetical protein GGR95_002969 [Sulfitobacter undariae]|uniref:Fibronectin type-III domain-containing protein n=1 Tax=Sulfitobacter undariae TaxID=1563671 RepID=A0A7W6H2Y4_9RHOB|nr:hypothetical protein [Sulfitobacter undariae]MBB3995314.1 hypothetical protein [Sulfitobacter undariae]